MVKANLGASAQLIQEVLKKKPLIGRGKYLKFQKELLRTLSGLDSLEVAELLLRVHGDPGVPDDLKEQCRMAIGSIRSRMGQ